MTKYVQIAKVDPSATLPTYGTSESAGMDLYSLESVSIQPNQIRLIRTGISMEIPTGMFGLVRPRGGHGMRGLVLMHSGIIDSDFRGEIRIGVTYMSDDAHTVFSIEKGERFAQMILLSYAQAKFDEVDPKDLSSTVRGTGELGSTGRR